MSQEITRALEYLKSRGHAVGDGFMPPKGNKLHFWVDNRACAFEHIRILAAMERMKESIVSTDSIGLTELAAMCRKLTDSKDVDSKAAARCAGAGTGMAVVSSPNHSAIAGTL